MIKYSLKKKIYLVLWSAIIFAIGYFLLGVFLTRTGPNLDTAKAYELITTSLTLTAYFIAPVAATILYSDWRIEHRIKITLEILEDLENLSFAIKKGLGFYNAKIMLDKFDKKECVNEFRNKEDRQTLLWELKALNRTKRKLLIENKEIDNLNNLLMSFYELAYKALNELHHKEFFLFESLCDQNESSKENNEKEYSKYSESFDKKFNEIDDLLDQIDRQVIKAQESILQS